MAGASLDGRRTHPIVVTEAIRVDRDETAKKCIIDDAGCPSLATPTLQQDTATTDSIYLQRREIFPRPFPLTPCTPVNDDITIGISPLFAIPHSLPWTTMFWQAQSSRTGI